MVFGCGVLTRLEMLYRFFGIALVTDKIINKRFSPDFILMKTDQGTEGDQRNSDPDEKQRENSL